MYAHTRVDLIYSGIYTYVVKYGRTCASNPVHHTQHITHTMYTYLPVWLYR